MSIHVSPGERNPVEGKFGQAKTAYGMNNILAKLKTTSESWIGSIVYGDKPRQVGGACTSMAA
jgi:hypothetical protein